MMFTARPSVCAAAIVAASLCGLPSNAVRADAIGDFYKDRTMTIIIGSGEGDGQDTYARILTRHWPRYLSGHPTMVPKNMPGAGSLRATNYLYSQAPTDGSTIAAIIPAFVLQQLVGGAGVNYDSNKFHWIGSTNASNPTIYVWHTFGVKSLEDATKREILMGATGAGSNGVLYPSILNNVLGTKFKVIMGYRSTAEVNIAVERGEIQGRAGQTFNVLQAFDAEWLADKKIDILVQIGRDKEPGYEHIPLATEFAKDQASRDVLQVFGDVIALGRPYLAPPGTPADRVAALRASFDAVLKDPEFLAEAKKGKLDVSPTKGEILQTVVAGMISTKADVLARIRNVMEASASAGVEGKPNPEAKGGK